MLKILGHYIHQSWFVVFWCIGVIAGTVLGLVFRVSFFTSVWWVVFSVLLLLFSYFNPKVIFVVIGVLTGMIMAFFRISSELYGQEYTRQFYGQTVLLSGVVEGDPEMDETSKKVKLTSIKYGEDAKDAGGSVYVSLPNGIDMVRSDMVTLEGKMTEGFGTYVGYMYKPKVVSVMRSAPGDMILNVRNWFAERIKRLIPEPEVNLGLSYLLGMKSGLPKDLAENLRVVGLVHIVVASGAHLSLLVEFAKKIFGKISRFAGAFFSVLFILFFMSMVGWTPSILRAGMMSIMTIIAWYVGRKIAAWRIILIVGALTLMINPMFVINLGWLLSFASFTGIMVFSPKLKSFFYGNKKVGFVAETIITTIAATIMTLPIVLYFYGTVSLISLVANLLILPTLSYAMGLVFLVGVISGIPVLDGGIAFLAVKLLDYHITVVEFFGGMKSFLVEIPPYRVEVFLIYVLILMPFAILLLKRKMVKLREE